MDILQKAVAQNLISLDDEQKYITYVRQNKRRNFQNPEEKVQAEAFCRLVLEYGYSATRIEMFVSVQMGVDVTKEADIIVYHDDARTKPYIVAECKSPDVSEMEFKQAVNQAFSYAHAIAGTTKFVWVTKGNKQEFYRYDKESDTRTPEAELPYLGESNAKKYRFAKGEFYTEKVKGVPTRIKTNDLKPVAESELTRIFKQAHDALWAGGELNPSQAFDELDKLIFCKVWDERNTKKGEPYQFQIFSEQTDEKLSDDEKRKAYEKNLQALRTRIFALYDKGKDKDENIFNKPIDLSNERIKTVVEYFQEISFSETDLDSKGKAFETFLGAYFRGEFGQYFTPRNVVKFAVEILPITNEHRVLDTSCGSGGFLLYVLDKVRRQATEIYPNHETNVADQKEWKPYWHNFAEKNLFGIEINDQISRVAKMNMIIHDDGHTNVVTYDGLYQIDHIAEAKNNQGFRENSFDFIVTNPPFGSIVRQSEKAYMQVDKTTAPYYNFATKEMNWIDAKIKGKHTATGRENQSTEVLFIEQCHKFLKAGGYIAVVVPDGILTNSSSQYVRDSIEEKFRIVAVVSLPQTAFTNTGAGVKSSVLVLKKHAAETTAKIQRIKRGLQDTLADETKLVKTFADWEREKKEKLKELKKVEQTALFPAGVAAETPTESLTKESISEEYGEKISGFKEDLEETYQAKKRERLDDYPIFMAIADNIGYDAAGKNTYRVTSREEYDETDAASGFKRTFVRETQENDLFTATVVRERKLENGKEVENTVSDRILPAAGIVGELRRFIEAIETGDDSFFASALS